jgi:small subunit ribosomal protein S14
MATTAKIAKEAKTPKFKVRLRNRCKRCGRPRAYLRKFALCRLCFRKLALEGDIAGVTKSSGSTASASQLSAQPMTELLDCWDLMLS